MLKDDMVARSVKKQRPFILEHPNGLAANAVRGMVRRFMQALTANGFASKNIFERVLETKNTQVEWSH